MQTVFVTDKQTAVTLLVVNAVILTMDARHTVIKDGALAINDSDIIAIGKTDDILQQYKAVQVVDAKDCLIIPGLINAHTHIPMSYFKGLADDLPLDKWLNDFIWPLETKLVNYQFVHEATLHGAAELIKNGVTLANDMYFEGEAMAEAIIKSGMRCIIGDPVLGTALKSEDDICKLGSAAIINSKKYKGNPRLDFSLAPHAIYSNSRPILEKCAEVGVENDLPVHMHISEAEWEVEDCLKANGRLPVLYLEEIGLLETRLVLAHGIYVMDDEMDILAEHNTAIAICTESNLKLANGFAPIRKYLQHKVRLCFGTDGVASNNNLDLLSELDFTAKLHKTLCKDPAFLPAEQMLSMATIEAARAVHKDNEIGSLETGKKADLVILDCSSIEAQPLYNPYSQVVYALGGRAVRDVVINGDIVLRDKKLTRLDEAELVKKAKEYRIKIKKELKR
jgi:5-methylthioadenosine/S-adenosylhomocysteine deaminase